MLNHTAKSGRGDTPAVATLAAASGTDGKVNAVADEGSPTPRRALGPLPDDGEDAFVGGGPARGLSPDEPSSLTSTGSFRRLALSPASPGSPDDPLDVPATTPVPPPKPVLPDPEAALPPATGRRFSASAEPSEFAPAAPRRSAVSATSPSSPFESLPPAPRPTAPPPRTVPVSSAPPPVKPAGAAEDGLPRSVATAPTAPAGFSPAPGPAVASLSGPAAATSPVPPTPTGGPSRVPGGALTSFSPSPRTPDSAGPPDAGDAREDDAAAPAPERKGRFGRPAKPAKGPAARTEPAPKASKRAAEPAPRDRSSRPALIIISAVLAVALLVAGGVWLLTLRSGAPSGSPSTTASALDPLLTSQDLGSLGQLTWGESTGTADQVRPLCLPATGAGLPSALRTASRKIPATGVPEASVVQVVDTYPDVATATAAYSVRLTQAGTCKDDAAWIVGGNAVTGLADAATAVRLLVHDATDIHHTLLLSRTGRSISLVDVATTEAVPAQDVAQVTSLALSRQCGGDLGTCPGGVATTSASPPPGDPRGWLVEADLPRISAGAGRWGGTDPFTTLRMAGSQCEGMNLETVAGTSSVGQRTLLMAEDPNAPTGFGVDMVTYGFGSADAAKTLATKLTKNIGDCPAKYPTASVATGPDANGTADAGSKVTGSTYLITQKTATTTVVYRVAVVTVGAKVVYLLGNPTAKFDFTDTQWKAIAVRAGQRAAQA